MKIDVHAHTKKCKKGDALTRNVSPQQFCDTILATEVKIIAITNHNTFDIDQFNTIHKAIRNEVQVWPGIELDILEDGKRGHLLVIVSPSKAEEFSKIVESLTAGSTPDSFVMSIDDTISHFDLLGPLYIAHYIQKKPDVSEIALEKLIDRTANASRVIKEVTNSISAGIYISHGHPSIFGSDVQDWGKYKEVSYRLPDLRLPVESFEHFCLLLEKDPTTINTLLDKKTPKILVLKPFDDDSEVKLKVYNDINIFFGSKGTGKSRILAAISKHFTSEGIEARVFESGNGLLEEKYDLRCNDFTINLENYGINYCTDEIEFIRKAKEVDVTSITNYVIFYKSERSSRNAQKIRLKDLNPEEESRPKRKFEDYNESASTVKEFLFFLNQSLPVKEVFGRERLDELYSIISELFEGLSEGKWDNFVKWKEVCFLNAAIKTCKREVTRKTGTPAKPSMTGFKNYALNRITTEVRAKEILNNVSKPISEQVELVGNLGANKGELKCKTKVVIQDGNITDSTLSPVAGVNKSTQKYFVRQLKKIVSKVYSKELFESIAELNRIEKVETIKTIHELLLVKRYFSMDDKEYNPSSGESSMLLLQNELGADKDVYILDEPEKSLGNDYINDVIVPLIKEKARAGKKVFISTHDANIAVRTLPYSSIYRCHGPKGYQTYTGNPFSNHLVNICDNSDKIDWKKVSMKTLEGGEEAFGERGKIYGNT